jgi:glutamate formiminotransferase
MAQSGAAGTKKWVRLVRNASVPFLPLSSSLFEQPEKCAREGLRLAENSFGIPIYGF